MADSVVDLTHNSVTVAPAGWLHRKGAAPNTGGLVALPGSRGTRSHLVTTSGNTAAVSGALWSVAHGAGRKHARSAARARFSDVPQRQLRTNEWGSVVVCTDKNLLVEEAAGAYKDIEVVVDALVTADLVTRVAATVPVVTFKTDRHEDRGAKHDARDRKARRSRGAR